MLVLSRKKSETIVLPTLGITINVLAITGNRVRIGIQAPREIPVLRQEIAERVSANRTAGRQGSTGDGESLLLQAAS